MYQGEAMWFSNPKYGQEKYEQRKNIIRRPERKKPKHRPRNDNGNTDGPSRQVEETTTNGFLEGGESVRESGIHSLTAFPLTQLLEETVYTLHCFFKLQRSRITHSDDDDATSYILDILK